MASKLAFTDTETISLRSGDKVIWDFAVVLREGNLRDEHQFFIEADFGAADPHSLKIGHFYERGGYSLNFFPRAEAAQRIEHVLRGRHLVGSCPSFDEERVRLLCQSNNYCPSWHYQSHEIEDICIGFCRGKGESVPDLPIDTDEMSLRIGVEPPSESERHTALGDARWVERMWEKVVGF